MAPILRIPPVKLRRTLRGIDEAYTTRQGLEARALTVFAGLDSKSHTGQERPAKMKLEGEA